MDEKPYLKGSISSFLYDSINHLDQPDGVIQIVGEIRNLLENEHEEIASETISTLLSGLQVALYDAFNPSDLTAEQIALLCQRAARILVDAGGAELLEIEGFARIFWLGSNWPIQLSIETAEEALFYLIYGVVALRSILTLDSDKSESGITHKTDSLLLPEFLYPEGRLTVLFALMGFGNIALEFDDKEFSHDRPAAVEK